MDARGEGLTMEITKDAGPVRLETVLRVKRASSGALTFTGWASTNDLDRVGDRVEPRGAVFTAPLPLLWQHLHAEPLGVVEAAHVTDRGIRVTFRLLPEVAKTAEAVALIEAGALALSIGFIGEEWEALSNGGRRWTKWTWTELSLVSVPANASATIDRIGKGIAVQRQPVRVIPQAEPVAKPRKSILRAAEDLAALGGADERQRFYAVFDAATECLPVDLRMRATVTRAHVDPVTTAVTFEDTRGRAFATVADDGTVTYPGQEAPDPPKSVPAGLTPMQAKQVRTLMKDVVTGSQMVEFAKAFGGVVKEALEPLRERLDRLEATALHDGGFYVDGREYRKGAVVVNDGQTWVATEDTEATPARGAQGWRLLARKTA